LFVFTYNILGFLNRKFNPMSVFFSIGPVLLRPTKRKSGTEIELRSSSLLSNVVLLSHSGYMLILEYSYNSVFLE
jgi:hypothetical protein